MEVRRRVGRAPECWDLEYGTGKRRHRLVGKELDFSGGGRSELADAGDDRMARIRHRVLERFTAAGWSRHDGVGLEIDVAPSVLRVWIVRFNPDARRLEARTHDEFVFRARAIKHRTGVANAALSLRLEERAAALLRRRVAVGQRECRPLPEERFDGFMAEQRPLERRDGRHFFSRERPRRLVVRLDGVGGLRLETGAFTSVEHDVLFERHVEDARVAAIDDERGVSRIVAPSYASPTCGAGRQLNGDTDRRMLHQPLVRRAGPIVAVDRAEERPGRVLRKRLLHELGSDRAELRQLVAGAAHAAVAAKRFFREERFATLLRAESRPSVLLRRTTSCRDGSDREDSQPATQTTSALTHVGTNCG